MRYFLNHRLIMLDLNICLLYCHVSPNTLFKMKLNFYKSKQISCWDKLVFILTWPSIWSTFTYNDMKTITYYNSSRCCLQSSWQCCHFLALEYKWLPLMHIITLFQTFFFFRERNPLQTKTTVLFKNSFDNLNLNLFLCKW